MEVDIRKKKKIEKITEFAKRIKKIQEKVVAILRKAQEEIKRQADREQREIEKQKKDDKIILSTKNLVFKKILVKKLTD